MEDGDLGRWTAAGPGWDRVPELDGCPEGNGHSGRLLCCSKGERLGCSAGQSWVLTRHRTHETCLAGGSGRNTAHRSGRPRAQGREARTGRGWVHLVGWGAGGRGEGGPQLCPHPTGLRCYLLGS